MPFESAAGDGGAEGHEGLAVVGQQHLVGGELQTLGEDAHQRGAEMQRAAFEDDRRMQLQALREAADGLLGDGVEAAEGDVLAARPLQQQRLDVGLGKDTAATADVVHRLALCGQPLQPVGVGAEERGNLVDESPRAAGAAAVHAHIVHSAAGEEHHLGILAAQLDGGAHLGEAQAHGGGVGHHLLHEYRAQHCRHGLATRAADGDGHRLLAVALGHRCKHSAQRGHLLGVVAAVVAVFNRVRLVDHHHLHRRGADVDTHAFHTI